MKPDPNNVTIYCLVTNSSFVSSGLMRVSVAFVSRNLTTATVSFRPGGVALYSHEMAIEYSLFDQWGDLYSNVNTNQIAFNSSLCNDGVCSYAYKGLATAERVLSFNFSSWVPVTKVSVSLLPYQAEPATFYCKTLTLTLTLILAYQYVRIPTSTALSLDIPVLLLTFALVLWSGLRIWKMVLAWRKRMKEQRDLLEEKEKELLELKSLWNVDPSFIEWEELLSRLVGILGFH